MDPKQAKAALLQRADMDHIFDSLDVNKDGKIAPREIDKSLEYQIGTAKTNGKLFIAIRSS